MSGKYRTIVADPPWQVLRPGGGTRTGSYRARGAVRAEAKTPPYATMTLDAIKALPVESWAADRCHLYLWTVNKYVTEAYDVARAWGFDPVTLLVWAKEPIGKGPGGLFSITTEFVLYAKRGPEPRRMVVPTSWWSWPRRGQSVKPEAFYDLVESVSAEPRLEMFSRRARLGWDTYGDEALHGTEAIPA